MIISYKEITNKYLKTNKKRTILALIGIVLSVSLISAIGLFFISMQKAQIEDEKMKSGSFHIMFRNADDNLITKIRSNPKIKNSGLYLEGKKINIRDGLYASEITTTDEALKLLPIKIKTGRFPQAEGEVALEGWFAKTIKYDAKVGDKLKIADKEYTLVGLLADNSVNHRNQLGLLVMKTEHLENASSILLAELNTKGNFSKTLQEVESLAKAEDVTVNRYLTVLEGQDMPEGILQVLAIIVAVVVISTIAVIYNTFQISVVERVRQFGLLRAVGATPKQIRRIILREATFLSAIGIPAGIAFGILALYAIYFTFKIIGGESILFISPTIHVPILLISIAVGLVSVYVSALLPALFAGRISPLVAISSRNSIHKEKIKRRKNRIVGKVFGFEGALAFKNIKRNRKRYRTTVFSIVISVMLFITFKSFMDMSLNVYGDNLNESKNIHFTLGARNREIPLKESTKDKVKEIQEVEKIYGGYETFWFQAAMDPSKEIKEVRNISNAYSDSTYKGEKKTLLGGALLTYDEAALEVAKNYLSAGSIDANAMNKENGVIIIHENRVYNLNTKRTFYGSISNLKVGDEIFLQRDLSRNDNTAQKLEFGKGTVEKVKVVGIINSEPFNTYGAEHALKMVTTEQVASRLASKEVKPVELKLKLKDVKMEENVTNALDRISSQDSDVSLVNYIDQNRHQKSIVLMIKILLYGFVIVVSLIGSVNIVNTLTTNIILRRKEFGALKSIGLTQKGLKKIIVLEGMLYGIVGSIYGSILGCVFYYLMYNGMNDAREQVFSFPFAAVAIAMGGAILIGYLSVLAPLKRVGKDNLIESLREEF